VTGPGIQGNGCQNCFCSRLVPFLPCPRFRKGLTLAGEHKGFRDHAVGLRKIKLFASGVQGNGSHALGFREGLRIVPEKERRTVTVSFFKSMS